ncbi:unnamed protein product [Haemonchus placei]|uniref:DUF1376 domain-containing protein n=1 Tax=Haemonchus placei TaxID=6290 RepID=A0A0N4W2K5_HAEPC|nr:unnamed protein product [Haemonchus placei]
MTRFFLENIVKYHNVMDPIPLGWAKVFGVTQDTFNLKVEMSSSFWDFFLVEGRRNLNEYNRKNNCAVKVFRGKTVKVNDLESLSLYLRKRIRQYCMDKNLEVPEIFVKNAFLSIRSLVNKELKRFKSTELAIKLGWKYSDWQGSPIISLLNSTELNRFKRNEKEWGSVTLEEIIGVDINSVAGSKTQEVRKSMLYN